MARPKCASDRRLVKFPVVSLAVVAGDLGPVPRTVRSFIFSFLLHLFNRPRAPAMDFALIWGLIPVFVFNKIQS